MWSIRYNRYAGPRLFVALLVAPVLLAWLALWFSEKSSEHGWLLHGLHGIDAFSGSASLSLAFIAGWTVMVVAMMLPASVPLISLFHALTRRRRDHTRLTALLVSGYLAAWLLFGVLVRPRVAARPPGAQERARLPNGTRGGPLRPGNQGERGALRLGRESRLVPQPTGEPGAGGPYGT